MPEGDTIRILAGAIGDAIGGEVLTVFDTVARGPRPALGEAVDEVRARGKHLLVGFSGGMTLHTHLGMDGSWRVGTATASVTRAGPPGRGVVAVVGTSRGVATCRGTRTVELLDAADLRRHPVLASLGPDLCDPDPDLDEGDRRLRAEDPSMLVAVALLEQRIAAGIGNVYRSEVLWAESVDPVVAVGELGSGTGRRLYATAHRLLRANLGGHRRRTVPDGLAVYERAGRRCRRCDGTIAVRRIGERARTVWWCPSCQTGR